MPRLTHKGNAGQWVLPAQSLTPDGGGYTGQAVDRLALFEDVYEHLIDEQSRIQAQLDQLRMEGKQKSVRFRELLAEKLLGGNLIAQYRLRGLK